MIASVQNGSTFRMIDCVVLGYERAFLLCLRNERHKRTNTSGVRAPFIYVELPNGIES
jgi:hypothetical protein